MANWSRYREYRQSSDGIEYCLSYSESRFEIGETMKECGGFMEIFLGNLLKCHPIVCVGSYGGEEEIYYKLYEEQFINELRSNFPDISGDCAGKLAKTFMDILLVANVGHRCPEFVSGGLSTLHFLAIKIKPSQHPMATEVITGECDGDGALVVHPRTRPTTRASVAELLRASTTHPGIVKEEEAECGICLEDMATLVRMPCSHPFHRVCLVRWLDNYNSCPICRFQIPAAQYQSQLDDCNSPI